jgi:transposase
MDNSTLDTANTLSVRIQALNEAFHLNEELKKDVWETCKKRIEKELEKAEKEFAVL